MARLIGGGCFDLISPSAHFCFEIVSERARNEKLGAAGSNFDRSKPRRHWISSPRPGPRIESEVRIRGNETRIPVPFGNRPATKRFSGGIVSKQPTGIFGTMEIGSKRAGTRWLVRVALATAVMAVVGLFGDSAGTAEIQTWSAHPAAFEV